jgi:hypothetical protein
MKYASVFYAIVQYSFSCVWVVPVGVACSHSGVAVPTGPADVSEDEIRATENYVIEKNWTQYFGSDTMLDDTSSHQSNHKI